MAGYDVFERTSSSDDTDSLRLVIHELPLIMPERRDI